MSRTLPKLRFSRVTASIFRVLKWIASKLQFPFKSVHTRRLYLSGRLMHCYTGLVNFLPQAFKPNIYNVMFQ